MEKKLIENQIEEEKKQQTKEEAKEEFRRNTFMKQVIEMCLSIKDPSQMQIIIEFMGIFTKKRD